jgi:hypothetical protein
VISLLVISLALIFFGVAGYVVMKLQYAELRRKASEYEDYKHREWEQERRRDREREDDTSSSGPIGPNY